jgi:hypothetical protein
MGAQIPSARSPGVLNSVWWPLILLGVQRGACFISPFGHPQIWAISWIFGNLSTIDIHQDSSCGLLPWGFSTEILHEFLIYTMRKRPAHVILGSVIVHIVQILGEGFKLRISSLCNFSPSFCSSFLCWNPILITSYWCYFCCVYKY